MTTSNRLFGNILKLYMATAQSPNFGYWASIILLLRISQLFIYCKSTNYFTTGNRLNIWLLCIEKWHDNFKSSILKYSDDIQLLRKAKFFGSCAPYYYFASPHLPIICLLQIDQLFHHWKSSKYLFIVHRNIVWLLQIAY